MIGQLPVSLAARGRPPAFLPQARDFGQEYAAADPKGSALAKYFSCEFPGSSERPWWRLSRIARGIRRRDTIRAIELDTGSVDRSFFDDDSRGWAGNGETPSALGWNRVPVRPGQRRSFGCRSLPPVLVSADGVCAPVDRRRPSARRRRRAGDDVAGLAPGR